MYIERKSHTCIYRPSLPTLSFSFFLILVCSVQRPLSASHPGIEGESSIDRGYSVNLQKQSGNRGRDQLPLSYDKHSAAKSADACTLLTRDEIEDILGSTVGEPHRDNTPGTASTAEMSHCTFATSDTPTKTIGVMLRRSRVADNTSEAINWVRQTVNEFGGEPEDIDSLGNAAFWGNNQLHIFKGDQQILFISIFGIKDDLIAREKASLLAQKALSRL